jgi:hypothetical protein
MGVSAPACALPFDIQFRIRSTEPETLIVVDEFQVVPDAPEVPPSYPAQPGYFDEKEPSGASVSKFCAMTCVQPEWAPAAGMEDPLELLTSGLLAGTLGLLLGLLEALRLLEGLAGRAGLDGDAAVTESVVAAVTESVVAVIEIGEIVAPATTGATVTV